MYAGMVVDVQVLCVSLFHTNRTLIED